LIGLVLFIIGLVARFGADSSYPDIVWYSWCFQENQMYSTYIRNGSICPAYCTSYWNGNPLLETGHGKIPLAKHICHCFNATT